MGRVSRYKKVKNSVKNFGQHKYNPKQNDPLNLKKNELKEVDGFYIEKESKRKISERNLRNEYLTDKPKKHKSEHTKNTAVKHKKQIGETNKEFVERVTAETYKKVASTIHKSTNASKKKKEFFQNRKDKKKKRKQKPVEPIVSTTSTTKAVETRRVGVHDVAVQPPELNVNFNKSRFKGFKSLSRMLN